MLGGGILAASQVGHGLTGEKWRGSPFAVCIVHWNLLPSIAWLIFQPMGGGATAFAAQLVANDEVKPGGLARIRALIVEGMAE